MTDDIVAWLRVVSDDYGMGRCEEAADEIERLRAILRETLAIAERNETGAWADRARAALGEKAND